MQSNQNPTGLDAKGIARALRTQLQHLGVELTHSAVLELVAKTASLKDWNTLAAKSAPATAAPTADRNPSKGLYCPNCGKQGTVSVEASAFVEQGTGNEDGYLHEGNADHHVCKACGYQFLEWASSWPHFAQMPGYVLMVEPYYAQWRVSLYPLGTVCAVLNEHGWDMPEHAMPSATDPQAVVQAINQMAAEELDANQSLIGRIEAYGASAYSKATGATLNDAVKDLLSRMPASIDAQVMNRDIGIG